jgi:hypothetical protein
MKDDSTGVLKANRRAVGRLMEAANHAELFIDLRDFIAAMADKKAHTPYKEEVAKDLLKRLDAFTEPNYTENVIYLKSFLRAIGELRENS